MDNNNLEYKINGILTAVPSGTFVSATPMSGLFGNNFFQKGDYGSITSGILGNFTINSSTIINGIGLSQINPTSIWSNNIAANEFIKNNNTTGEIFNVGTIADDYKINITATVPDKLLFIDKCSSQFFTETGLMQDFAYACTTNNLTCVVTYPDLTQEYKQDSITLGTILFGYGWTILKTSFSSNSSGKTHAGERELISYISNNQNLYGTATIVTGEKRVINECSRMGIKNLTNWDFIIFMIIKKIVNWSKAEEIYKRFSLATEYNNHQNYKIKGYKTLKDYYIKNQKNIIEKIEKII